MKVIKKTYESGGLNSVEFALCQTEDKKGIVLLQTNTETNGEREFKKWNVLDVKSWENVNFLWGIDKILRELIIKK